MLTVVSQPRPSSHSSRDTSRLGSMILTAFLVDKLAKYEMPTEMEIRASLPRTPVGKLSKKELVAEETAKRPMAEALQ